MVSSSWAFSRKQPDVYIVYDDPASVSPESYRFGVGAVVHEPIDEENAWGVVNRVIPEGRCARLRHDGGEDTLYHSVMALLTVWFPTSGEVCGDFPMFYERMHFFPDRPESEWVTDIYLPLV